MRAAEGGRAEEEKQRTVGMIQAAKDENESPVDSR